MKRCPYCAEEIQDQAIVCKHCGRDLTEKQRTPPPQKIEIVQKKKTGCVAAGCAVVLVLVGVGFLISVFQTPARTPVSPPPAAAPAVPAGPGPSGQGKFEKYSYEYKTQGGISVFLFTPAMPMDDAVAMRAMRHLLSRHFKANLNRATTKPAGRALRFITASGTFDVTPVKSDHTLLGFGIQRR